MALIDQLKGAITDQIDTTEKKIYLLLTILGIFIINKLKKKQDEYLKRTMLKRPALKAIETKVSAVPKSFNWAKTEPRPYRPFRAGPYYMTMGLTKCSPNDWLLLENTYKDITKLRSEIVDKHRQNTVLHHPMADDPIKEVYDMCVNYVLTKFPKYFVVDSENPELVHNKITDVKIPKSSTSFTSKDGVSEMIRTIARNIEEDFLILMYNEDDKQYYLRSGTFAFPSGFDPAEKLNLALKDIHGPVPLYKQRLEESMDRYFERIKVDEWIERFNWGIQTHEELYAPVENHAAPDTEVKALKAEDLDFSKVFLRCERQILTRLPKTQALLFTIRTYLTPLSQIRKEPRALELADAIQNLPDSLAHYKKREEWGDAVIQYLNHESNGKKK